MNIAHLYSQILTLPNHEQLMVNEFVNKLKKQKNQQLPGENRMKGFGALKGKISITDDFDAPLDDFNEYM